MKVNLKKECERNGMINFEERIKLASLLNNMTNEELLFKWKDIDRKCRSLVSEIASYQSEETFDKVMELSELEYQRKIIVDRIIGKAVE